MSKNLEELETQHDTDERIIKRLEKSKTLSQKETEFLREQLVWAPLTALTLERVFNAALYQRSYDMEEVTMSQSADNAKLDRFARHEELLEEHKQRIVELEQELQNFKSTAVSLPDQLPHADDVASMRKEVMQKDHGK